MLILLRSYHEQGSLSRSPEQKTFMDKKALLTLNGGRHVQRVLWGFDPFMNLVIGECVEVAASACDRTTPAQWSSEEMASSS